MLLKQIKIVVFILDRCCDVDFIKELFDVGMNVVCMNIVYVSCEGFEVLIVNVCVVFNCIVIFMDIKGLEVCIIVNVDFIFYQIGEKVKIVGDFDCEIICECIVVLYLNFVYDLNVGGIILIDDGDFEL